MACQSENLFTLRRADVSPSGRGLTRLPRADGGSDKRRGIDEAAFFYKQNQKRVIEISPGDTSRCLKKTQKRCLFNPVCRKEKKISGGGRAKQTQAQIARDCLLSPLEPANANVYR